MVLVIYCKIWNFIITFFKGGGRGKMEQQLNVTSCAKKVKSQNFQISLGNVVCVGHTGQNLDDMKGRKCPFSE